MVWVDLSLGLAAALRIDADPQGADTPSAYSLVIEGDVDLPVDGGSVGGLLLVLGRAVGGTGGQPEGEDRDQER